MILRKPYAFLIKNFKLIHGILTIILGFIMYHTHNIYIFLKEYLEITRNLKVYAEPLITSVSWYIYIFIILAIMIFGVIFTLMNRKEKPIKYYLYAMIFYFIVVIAFLFSSTQISALIRQDASLSIVSAARDIMQMIYWGQYVFLFISLLRTIGFNVKKFNFQSELRELNILEEDNEEFEFEVEVDSEDVKSRVKRTWRMTKYFLIENKIVLIPIVVISILVLSITIFLNVEIYNKIYKEKENFIVQGLNMKILNSYETKKDYSGRDISEGKHLYYVTEVEVSNKTNDSKVINLDNIRLKIGEYDYYDVLIEEANNFIDLGELYSKQVIKSGTTSKYIFSFKVDEEYNRKTKILEYLKGYDKEGFIYTKVKLNPQNIDKTEVKSTVNLKETLDMDEKTGKISLNIDEYSIAPTMEYEYQEIINGNKYKFTEIIQPSEGDLYSKQVLKLKSNIIFKEVYNDNIVDEFISKFGSIRYIKDGKEYYNSFKMKDITPSSEKEYTFLEVTSELLNAEHIYLDIIMRTNKYTYILK